MNINKPIIIFADNLIYEEYHKNFDDLNMFRGIMLKANSKNFW